ncbi:MAG TPA: MAPEG family protein [Caulobacteraceae bacterium]
MDNYLSVAAVTLVSLLVYFWLGIRVAGARRRHGIAAPAISGHEDFERVFRAHQNTLEWLPMYIASLWLFAIYWSAEAAAIIGLVWIVRRILYGLGYAKAAGSRSTGFMIQALAVAVLLFGALGRILWLWLQGS